MRKSRLNLVQGILEADFQVGEADPLEDTTEVGPLARSMLVANWTRTMSPTLLMLYTRLPGHFSLKRIQSSIYKPTLRRLPSCHIRNALRKLYGTR